MKSLIKEIKEIKIPFFNKLDLFIKNINTNNKKDINIIIKIPKELEILKDIVEFEIKTLAKNKKKNINIIFDFY